MTPSFPTVLISIPEGVIDLGWGHPSPRLHPLAALQQAANHLFANTQVAAVQYGAEQGFGPLLESLAAFLSQQEAYAMQVEPETLFLTAGASQALDLACTRLTKPGDTVWVEEPTYYQVQRIFADHHLRVIGVPTDAAGVCLEALAALLADATSPRPTLLYTIPTFQNPAGSVLPPERRRALLDLAQHYCFTVVADDVYHLLYYGVPPPPPLVAFDTSASGCVISLGSFSKILAPGLRLGWVQAHPRLIQRFVQAGMVASGGGLNPFTAALVHATLELGLLAPNIATLRTTYGERVRALDAALRTHLRHDVCYTLPGGGYFFWLTCQDDVDTEALLPLAQQVGLSYRPGQAFSTARLFPQALRVSFALYEADALDQGVARLAEALARYGAGRRPAKPSR
ncbi:2-aminoadipate transaminase [Candidatus Entotheonellaceae bacterium PAL068K]